MEITVKIKVPDGKICPIMSKSESAIRTGCAKERCALWFDGSCAIVAIAKSLRGPVAVKDVTPVPGL